MSNRTNIFELSSGQKIQLVELQQSLTYEGLIAGVPNEVSNARLIERALDGAVRHHLDGAPHLIEPVQTPIEMGEREKAQEMEYPSPFGPPQFLPGVLCVGRFESVDPVGEEEESEDLEAAKEIEPFDAFECKWLVVVWFQDEFALPIDAGVEEAIQKLDWHAVAHGGGGLDWL